MKEKTLREKGEIARNGQFLLSLSMFFFFFFYRIDKLPSILTTSQTIVFKRFQFETVETLSPGNGQVFE